eukprot:Selendium_serpulae@DN5016_c0_g1_i3.p2
MAADTKFRNRFLDGVDALLRIGFDGVDINWNVPGVHGSSYEGDYKNYLQLMEAIRGRIGPDKLLTAALPADTTKLFNFDFITLAQHVDHFNVLTYDMMGPWSATAGHNAPLHSYGAHLKGALTVDFVREYLFHRTADLAKVNLGVPFSGYGIWTANATAALGGAAHLRAVNFPDDGFAKGQESSVDLRNWLRWEGAPIYKVIAQDPNLAEPGPVRQRRRLGASSWTKFWDDEAQVPYALNGKYFLSFDNPESVAKKAEYVVAHGVGGVAVSNVHGDIKCDGGFVQRGPIMAECTILISPLAERIITAFGASPSSTPPRSLRGRDCTGGEDCPVG